MAITSRPLALVAPGENPHTYQPTDAQVSRLMRASGLLPHRHPFENGPWFQAIQSAPGPKIVDLRQGIALREMAEEAHAEQPKSGADGTARTRTSGSAPGC